MLVNEVWIWVLGVLLIKFWQIKFEWFSLQIRVQVKNRGMLPHDRNIDHHDRDRSSTSRALLGLTLLDSLVCSRSLITIVTSCFTIVTMLTVDYHDRDSLWGRFWGAHDRSSRSWPCYFQLVTFKNFWFLIGLSLVYFWFILGFCLAFLRRYITNINFISCIFSQRCYIDFIYKIL